MPTQIPAAEFARNFGRYREEAHTAPVRVTSHGRIVGAFISAEDLAHFERLKKRERQVLAVEDLPEDLVAAIETAEYGRAPD